jgi:DNA-binding response OmpR family regulator
MPVVRVLVVEDETRLAGFIEEGLDAEGFDVELAHDGLDGLWRARERPTTPSSSTSCCRG